MKHLVLHPTTADQVKQFTAQPSHAVLLTGNHGLGKTVLAMAIATKILKLEAGALTNHPYSRLIGPEKNSISIEQIRGLQRFLQLKTIGQQPLRRAAIIEHADALTTEAQNAFLKILEEPPSDSLFILTASSQRALLPTITSRLQQITLTAPDEPALRAHFMQQGRAETAITQAYFLSGGLPGLMQALLETDSEHPLVAAVAQAKRILQAQTFERLAIVDELAKQKTQSVYTLEALQHIAQVGLGQAAAKAQAAKLAQWHRILAATTSALESLSRNANPKLVLSKLMLNL